MNQVQALLTAGWVALVRGDAERAVRHASAGGVATPGADATAPRSPSRSSFARWPVPRAGRDVERLAEAETIWRELGNPTGQARAAMVGAFLTGDDAGRPRAEAALAEVGAHGLPSGIDARPPVDRHPTGRRPVARAISACSCSGEPVPLGAWQSRKARDLLKILVARRGRPTPREALMEALWPGQSPGPLGNRLLGPPQHGPGRPRPRQAARPGPLRRCRQERRLARSRRTSRSTSRRSCARPRGAPRCTGPGKRRRHAGSRPPSRSMPATSSRRTRTRTGRSRCARRPARRTSRSPGRLPTRPRRAATWTRRRATRCACSSATRIDEPAHLGLVAALERAGRHGEARRRFRAYCARMDEIGVESAPFPAPQSRPEL